MSLLFVNLLPVFGDEYIQPTKQEQDLYKKLLAESREKTDWSQAQANQVIARIDNILEQLPEAKKVFPHFEKTL